MSRTHIHRIISATVAIAATVGLTTAFAQSIEPEVAPGQILVRLPQALEGMIDDGSFPLSTGIPPVDHLIDRFEVDRIEYALPISARNPGDPVAFRRNGLDRTYRFSLPPGADVRAIAAAFDALDVVDYAEPNYVGEPTATIPTDTRFDEQWHLHQPRGPNADADIDAPEAWDLATGDPSVVIGIADSGIDVDHVDLDETLWTNPDEVAGNGVDDDGNGYIDDVHGWNFATGTGDIDDAGGHGTWVASMAVAETNNAQGIAGVCWHCRTMATVRADNTHADYADSVIWAADHGAQIVNGSWGDGLTGSSTLASAIGYIADLGVIQVNSAGNYPLFGVSFPAAYVETIAVSATTITDARWSSSSYGPEVDVCAAGNNVLGAYFDGDYLAGDGTSASSPIAAGVAGLVLSVHPSAGRDEVRHLLQSGAEDEVGGAGDPPGFDDNHGWGRINAHRTVQAARSAVSLQVDGSTATRLTLATPNDVVDSYDFARGNLRALREDAYGVELGVLTCIENDSIDADTLGNEDSDVPAPGEGFFYVARFNAAPGPGPYGGSSRHRDRLVFDQATDAAWILDGSQARQDLGVSSQTAGDVNGDGYDDLVVGSSQYDSVLRNIGRAQVFHGSPTGLLASPAWTYDGDQEFAQAGNAVASAGDVNGDGYDDVLVGTWGYDAISKDEGRVSLFFGSDTGLEPLAGWTFDGDQEDAQLGFNVAAAGDIDNDGYDDFLVAAVRYDNTVVDEGRVYLFRGAANGPPSAADWTYDGGQESVYLGSGLGSAGDVNGDGFADVVMGAPYHDDGQTDEGRMYLFYGSGTGLGPSPDVEFQIDEGVARLGRFTTTAGDVNADGYDDVLASAENYPPGGGAVFVWHGSASGVDTVADWQFVLDQAQASLGWGTGSVGDVDGDGFSDIVASANRWDGRRSDEGRVWLFRGSSSGLASEPSWSREGRQPGARYGYNRVGSTYSAGDVDGDGETEFVVSAWHHDQGDLINAGRVYVYDWPLPIESPSDCPQ